MRYLKICINIQKHWHYRFAVLTMIFMPLCMYQTVNAAVYTPNDVYSQVNYANQLANELLKKKGIVNYSVPRSREKQAMPMHVYELHVSVLTELYNYAQYAGQRPPPVVVATPISYRPTDVYYLSQLVVEKLKEIHQTKIVSSNAKPRSFSNKTPIMVYQEVFALLYRLNLLNGRTKISPNEVFSHTRRAKEDLQRILLTLSRRIGESAKNERSKRLLTTAMFGTHPDGSSMAGKPAGKNPADVMNIAFEIRVKLNRLRESYNLSKVVIPNIEDYSKVTPADVFLQTQFIVAELNLLKQPIHIGTTTNRGKSFSGKTPSDVYYEMQHISYMLDRLLSVASL